MRRVPIASLEAEKGVLGSALIAPHIATEYATAFAPECFTLPAHQTIARAILAANSEGVATDYITFTQFLRDRGELDKVGGLPYLTELFGFVPSPANIGQYASIIHEKRRLRHITARCEDIIRTAHEAQDEPEAVFAEAQSALLEISSMAGGKSRTLTMRENVGRAFARIESLILGTITPGLPTGIAALDRRLGGLHDGEVIAITGDTGGGKTSLAHNIVDHVGVDLGKTVQVFSYELPALQVTNRMIAARGSINTEHIRKATMTPNEAESFTRTHDILARANIFIEDDANTTLPQLQARARKLKASHDTALIVVDYIQKVPGSGKADRRQREIAENSDGIQKLAMELNIPVIVLAQWNKKDGSVREAADIVFDAKTLLKIVRDEMIDIEDEPVSCYRDIVIAKNNNGAIGKIPATFHKAFVRFESK